MLGAQVSARHLPNPCYSRWEREQNYIHAAAQRPKSTIYNDFSPKESIHRIGKLLFSSLFELLDFSGPSLAPLVSV